MRRTRIRLDKDPRRAGAPPPAPMGGDTDTIGSPIYTIAEPPPPARPVGGSPMTLSEAFDILTADIPEPTGALGKVVPLLTEHGMTIMGYVSWLRKADIVDPDSMVFAICGMALRCGLDPAVPGLLPGYTDHAPAVAAQWVAAMSVLPETHMKIHRATESKRELDPDSAESTEATLRIAALSSAYVVMLDYWILLGEGLIPGLPIRRATAVRVILDAVDAGARCEIVELILKHLTPHPASAAWAKLSAQFTENNRPPWWLRFGD